jgi:maltose phosphorylase
MHQYLLPNEWLIIEEGYKKENLKKSEAIFSLGNGHMGMRANFEEEYSGPTLRGFYIAGIYYPDKTRVGWWKNGYPEYFAKVLNAPNWLGLNLSFSDSVLNLDQMEVLSFRRVLNMKEGILYRECTASWPNGNEVKIVAERFLSMKRREIGAIRYTVTPINFSGRLKADLYIQGNVVNEDSNYDDNFWEPISQSIDNRYCTLITRTKRTNFDICLALDSQCKMINQHQVDKLKRDVHDNYVADQYDFIFHTGDEIQFTKIAAITTSRDLVKENIEAQTMIILEEAVAAGYHTLKGEQLNYWQEKWEKSDIIIDGDVFAQQGIRFNMFHLNQTYTGHDSTLNIGPKGFTGEKYGGTTYWDTEAFCLPFYLNTSGKDVAKNLLVYRYRHLHQAIENAKKLGFKDGAALYPMVTINGEECHNEWEITFEEIHRNGAIAYAIFNYIRHTGDDTYLPEFGLEVLIGIARFWSQRFTFSERLQKFVILGVTGPNEYENNVNNNWYTNYIATWVLVYTIECLDFVKGKHPDAWIRIKRETSFKAHLETKRWIAIINHVYLPVDDNLGIFLQQDGYLDKEQLMVSDLNPEERPINQHWSWDRILRSCFIKQADVLQGLYFFTDHFNVEQIRRNFDFYEPRTVHESSLSPCVHSVLASKLGYTEIAYQLYLRTSRLDLDDYNNEVVEGCHITSMAGTWLAIVEGFGGMQIKDNHLNFSPSLPNKWRTLTFTIRFRNHFLTITIFKNEIKLLAFGVDALTVYIKNKGHLIIPGIEFSTQL